MKTKLGVIADARSTEVKNLMLQAAASGSDNGLSANYLTVVLPIVQSKKVNEQSKPYGAFTTLLFNPETLEFVKSGSVSISGIQRTYNTCDLDSLPEGMTLEGVRALPTVEVIAGSSRTNGKSAYETVKDWFIGKKVIEKVEQKNIVQIAFDRATSQPVIEGTTIRKKYVFTPSIKEALFEKVSEILKELIEPSQDESVKSHFEAAGLELPYTR